MQTDDLRNSTRSMIWETTRTPHACTTKYSKDIQKEQCCILLRLEIKASPSRITPASTFLWVAVYFCRVDSDFFVRFENTAKRTNARRYATVSSYRQLCLLACAVALWSARTCLAVLCRANCAFLLECVCGRCSTTTCSYIPGIFKKGPRKQR